MINEQDQLKAALKVAQEGLDSAYKEISEIREVIYPGFEQCGCDSPCECKYPEGWVRLKDLDYHFHGTDIGIALELGKCAVCLERPRTKGHECDECSKHY